MSVVKVALGIGALTVPAVFVAVKYTSAAADLGNPTTAQAVNLSLKAGAAMSGLIITAVYFKPLLLMEILDM